MTAPAPVREKPAGEVRPPDAGPARPIGGGLLDPKQLWLALPAALRKLDPVTLSRNPVMFVTEIGAALTTGLAITHPSGFGRLISAWLWLTVVFANLAEAVAESRGRAQADTLRGMRRQTVARRLVDWTPGARDAAEESVGAGELRRGDLVVVARQQPGVVTVGTLQARGVNFVALATGAALVLAHLDFLPALSLGTLAEGLLQETPGRAGLLPLTPAGPPGPAHGRADTAQRTLLPTVPPAVMRYRWRMAWHAAN
ncbi:potassium-transporting ATPase subunit KdpA [Streptomyces sp. NPDC008092]|uniref:potassium-transporting ATPase subunit KdpA n=1 Tax=Streptomyces sp. NPDC008092 TaxID=3364808 RepID=UPI0036F01D28